MKPTPILLLGLLLWACNTDTMKQPELSALVLEKSTVKAEANGLSFRDLNSNGKLDVYEDPNQPTEKRVADLISRMTLAEKAGALFINGVAVNADASLQRDPDDGGFTGNLPTAMESIDKLSMNHFNVWAIPDDPEIFARWYNNLQQHAEQSRLGIPVSIATDPRHHFSESIFAMEAQGFSQFCETLGLAAIDDPDFVRDFANIVRKEYLAVGMRIALHPQADLATEPRWSRISGAFGEDADLTSRMVRAYLAGMQGDSLSAQSIACMTKHFPGGGPQKLGLDPHFEFQQGQIYPGDNFDYHLIPFEAAIESNTASIMPYYGVPKDQTEEEVAMAFNKAIITDLLRNKYHYEGVVCADWGVITDTPMGPNVTWPARAWGVEHLSEADRVLKVLEAGCDQFGGESRPELVIQLVEEGKLSEARIDESLRRILKQKFELALFDNPFVDETKVKETVGIEAHVALGMESQKRSLTLLKNENKTLPLNKNTLKVYVKELDSIVVAQYATVVATPQEADFAILRLKTPWEPVDTDNPFAQGFHHGDLDFKGAEKAEILDLLKTVPTVVDIYLDRPAVIPEIAENAVALVANYGASDQALCEVLFGNAAPEGKLPFELPSSMEAVRNQKTDVPYDSENPLFAFGFGLRYELE